MKLAIPAFVALLLALMLPLPATAGGSDEVALTFKLTLYGDVPQGEHFIVTFAGVYPNIAVFPVSVSLCGRDPSKSSFDSPVQCKSAGVVYTQTRRIRMSIRGTKTDTLQFRFFRTREVSDDGQGFFSGTRKINEEATISAHYNFSAADSDPQMPSQMPETGAGGGADSRLPTLPAGRLSLEGTTPQAVRSSTNRSRSTGSGKVSAG